MGSFSIIIVIISSAAVFCDIFQMGISTFTKYFNHMPNLIFSIKLLSHLIPLKSDVMIWHRFLIAGPLWQESSSHRWIPLTKRRFDICFVVRLNKLFNKQFSCRPWRMRYLSNVNLLQRIKLGLWQLEYLFYNFPKNSYTQDKENSIVYPVGYIST